MDEQVPSGEPCPRVSGTLGGAKEAALEVRCSVQRFRKPQATDHRRAKDPRGPWWPLPNSVMDLQQLNVATPTKAGKCLLVLLWVCFLGMFEGGRAVPLLRRLVSSGSRGTSAVAGAANTVGKKLPSPQPAAASSDLGVPACGLQPVQGKPCPLLALCPQHPSWVPQESVLQVQGYQLPRKSQPEESRRSCGPGPPSSIKGQAQACGVRYGQEEGAVPRP